MTHDEEVKELELARNNRSESSIPLDDNYWKLLNKHRLNNAQREQDRKDGKS